MDAISAWALAHAVSLEVIEDESGMGRASFRSRERERNVQTYERRRSWRGPGSALVPAKGLFPDPQSPLTQGADIHPGAMSVIWSHFASLLQRWL